MKPETKKGLVIDTIKSLVVALAITGIKIAPTISHWMPKEEATDYFSIILMIAFLIVFAIALVIFTLIRMIFMENQESSN